MASTAEKDSDAYHEYEQAVIKDFLAEMILKYSMPERSDDITRDLPKLRPISGIAIVGAGVAGLSAAMKLNSSGLDCPIDVYESSDRIGGRLYTHHFKGAQAAGGDYDYYDVGAMRFPRIPSMKPTFDLFDRLNIKLQDYHRTQPKNWLSYNNIRLQRGEIAAQGWANDPFHASVQNGGGVPDRFAEKGPQHWYSEAINPLLEEYKRLTMPDLIKKYDHYSIRGYMSHVMNYPTEVVNWIETMNSGTSWFDRGLMQAILEGVAFAKAPDDVTDTVWKCVDGGSDVVTTEMVKYIKNQKNSRVSIKTQHHVTAVTFHDARDLEVSGTTEGYGIFSSRYSHVILALPPACIRTVDLSTCELDFGQRNGLRELEVAPSSKIGMKFKTAWWRNLGITGGQSQTDRLARTIVYPSYGEDKSTVLIASYVWTQDSLVLGALMKGPGSVEEKRLKNLILADLAHVHGVSLPLLEDQFEAMYPFDWSANPLSMGAFGIFGPGQWGRFYQSLSRPAARGQLYFAGETFSSIHGWVAGALDSASKAVYELLNEHQWACKQAGPPANGPNPLDIFLEEWTLLFPEDEALLKQLLAASLAVQKEEFHY